MAVRGNTVVPIGRIIIILAIPLMVYLSYSAARNALDIYSLKQQADGIRQDIEVLRSRNADLKRQADYLSTDYYVEKIAREKLNLVKPGEISVIVLAPPAIDASIADKAASSETREDSPNWRKWWNYIFRDRD